MRIALGIEYDGSNYHGWQTQPGLRTIQQLIENALSKIAAHDISVVCAGRTDTGVHATNQVIHFDTDKERSLHAWTHGTNSFLPKEICVKWAHIMRSDFHARYHALARRYQYIIYNSQTRPALFRGNVTWHHRNLQENLMQEGAKYLLGENDYTSFRSIDCQSKTPMRNIHHIEVTRINNLIIIDITANAFLHHMVRNIVGVLITVGSGKAPSQWVKEVLEAKDRRLGAQTAPPYGLYLVEVKYPKEFNIAKPNPGPIFLLKD